jgi:hypothetical protein
MRLVSLLSFGLVLLLGPALNSQEPPCVNGKCKVAVPQQITQRTARIAVEVASAPVQVVRQVRTNQPVRTFVRRPFGGLFRRAFCR